MLAREGMQKVRSPRGSADLRGTPAELVELIDVSLGNHDVDGREHE